MTEALYPYVNLIAVYSLIISAILVFKDKSKIRGANAVVGFILCVIFYLIIDSASHPFLKWILLLGPFLLPFTFWLMARMFFNDDPLSTKQLIIYTVATIVVYYSIYILSDLSGLSKVLSIAGRALSLLFIVLAIVEAQSGKRSDLDEGRIRLRKYFTYFIGLVVLITILSELGLSKEEQELPRMLQRSAILIFNSLFIILNVSIKSHLFDTRKKSTDVKHPDLIEKIQHKMLDQQLYKQEKLTIGQLAEELGEQEYRVRRVINQEMGYRNFIDFTNSYRIKEASVLLTDKTHSNLTILEIAYKTGFNSIGPFNRAFKHATRMTPTEFRKRNLKN